MTNQALTHGNLLILEVAVRLQLFAKSKVFQLACIGATVFRLQAALFDFAQLLSSLASTLGSKHYDQIFEIGKREKNG